MKEDFIKYMGSIDMPKILIKRVESFYEFYCNIDLEEPEDIFVSEYINKRGSREFGDLRFYSPNYRMFSPDFVTNNEFVISQKGEKLSHLGINRQEYDFRKATEKSRLYVYGRYIYGAKAELKASGANCDNLKNILLKYYIPFLI